MANWNSGAYFNRDVNEYGFMWNGAKWITLRNMRETLKVEDEAPLIMAVLVLLEKSAAWDEVGMTALFASQVTEAVAAKDAASVVTLFELAEALGVKDDVTDLVILACLSEYVDLTEDVEAFAELLVGEAVHVKDLLAVEALVDVAENLGIKDAVTDLVVLAQIADEVGVLDEVRMFAEYLASEEFRAKDVMHLEAFLELAQKLELRELAPVLAVLLTKYDSFGITDHEPKKAVSDFLIGVLGDMDRAYDWLLPFGLRMDWSKTELQIMPEAELTTIEMPGADGSIVADTTYRDRLFKLVGYSVDGLTTRQKEDLKRKLTEVLDATKHQTKKLTVQARGTSFDVKYSGQAKIEEGPSYVKAEIPFHTGPYGRDMFDQELEGSGLVYNEGDTETGAVHIITGAVTDPRFTLGEVVYSYAGTVPSGWTLTVNHDMYTVFLTDPYGKRTNALKDFTGKFQRIPSGKSLALTASANTEGRILTRWVNRVLW